MRAGPVRAAFLLAALAACRGEPSAPARPAQPRPAAAQDGTGAADAAPPTAPQDLETRSTAASRIELSWTRSSDDTGVAGYEIEENGVIVARAADRTAVVDGLAPGVEHCYSVFALDTVGHRSPAAGPSCTTTVDDSPPSAPAALAVRADPGQASVSWNASQDDVGVVGYQVLRGGAAIGTTEATVFDDRSVRPGSRYCYAVVALDRAGNRSTATEGACADVPDVVPPTAPAQAKATAVSDRELAIVWSGSTDDSGAVRYEVLRGETVVARTEALAAREGGLLPGRRSCYTVVALDRAGNRSPPSPQACATTLDLTPPTPPTRVVARAWGEHEVAVGWEPSEDDVGVAGYELLRDGKLVSTSPDTNASDGGLAPWREYCYQVRAFDAAGNRSPSAGPACARTLDLTAPGRPAPVAQATSDKAIELEWKPSPDNVGVDRYEILRDERVIASGARPAALEKDLLPARRYCYTVRAVDPAGNASDPSAPVCVTTPDLAPPTTPGRMAIAPSAPTQVVLAWDPSQDDVGVIGYEIVHDGGVVATTVRGWATISGLAPQKEHCFAVRAYDAAGNRSLTAGPLCATTPEPGTPAAPVNVTAEAGSKGALRLRWDPSPDAGILYAVYRDENRRVGMTRSTSYTIAGLGAGERRCYRVAAVDADGRESPRTIPACAAASGAVSAR
jgi:chitodextrinase